MSGLPTGKISIAGVDLSGLFNPYTSSATASVTNLYVGGHDLNFYWAPYTSGATASATTVRVKGADLNTLFAPKSSITNPTTSGYTATQTAGGYTMYIYSNAGTFTFTTRIVNSTNNTISVLLVGGGGGGTVNGGSGGIVYTNSFTAASSTTYTIVVGAGGMNANGGNTTFTGTGASFTAQAGQNGISQGPYGCSGASNALHS
jgi:hypothetical protein